MTWSLDQFGRRTGMTDAAGTVRYAYDRVGRLATVSREGQPAVVYGYDTLNRLTGIRIGAMMPSATERGTVPFSPRKSGQSPG